MKYIIIVPDGAADYPEDILGGKTPLELADTPNMDYLAKQGIIGRVRTVPKGFSPASDVANLSLLGYSPAKYYSGRGPLEAANIGVKLEEGDVAFRCNLITEADGKIFDYSAGHITNREARILIEYLNEKSGNADIHFYPGVSYRHLMVYKKGTKLELHNVKAYPPHDIMGQSIRKFLPRGKNAQLLTKVMEVSKELLAASDINIVRIDLGENPANMIWLWGQGVKLDVPSFFHKFGLKGAVISAVNLIKGIGKVVGLRVLDVEGATGYYDTNYEGKAKAALESLEENDFVYVHIEAPDEAGHNNDIRMKIASLEKIDKLVLGRIIKDRSLNNTRILVVPDHFTPVSKRTHTPEPVPFVAAGRGIPRSTAGKYSEEEAQRSNLFFEEGPLLMKYFIKN